MVLGQLFKCIGILASQVELRRGEVIMVDFESDVWVYKEAISKSIDYNNGTVTRARLTATIVSTGDYAVSFFMTANGTDWEQVDNGVEYVFINTGSDLRWKIGGSGAFKVTKLIINITH